MASARRHRHWRVAAATLVASALIAAPALAAGGPPIPFDGGTTVSATSIGGELRYVSVPSGRAATLLAIRKDGGEVVQSHRLGHRYTLPAVALDGTASGVSADGSTVVLIEPRTFRTAFPRGSTSLLVFRAGNSGVVGRPRQIELAGDFGFDAIAPDGSQIYLVEHRSRNYDDYAIRTLDAASGRLDPDPVALESSEGGAEEMRGMPMTQAIGADGRWVYTLYAGGDEPFVHALDTVGRTSVCIDVPQLLRFRGVPKLALTGGGGTLEVTAERNDRRLAVIDTETFAVSDPAVVVAPAAAAASAPVASEDADPVPIWALGLAGVVALGLGCGFWLRNSRPQPSGAER